MTGETRNIDDRHETEHQSGPFWDPETGSFNGPRLHMAIMVRRWTAPEFARDAGINRCSIYNAINGRRLRDATALRIFETLATREPLALTG